jgi:hypothetical protein
MMRSYSFYHKDTGLFDGRVFTTDDEGSLQRNGRADHVVIEGAHDHLSKRVDIATGLVIEYQPPKQSNDREWNAKTKRWELTAAVVDLASKRAAAAARIAQLDVSSVPILREYALGINGASEKLRAINDEIAALRLIAGVIT